MDRRGGSTGVPGSRNPEDTNVLTSYQLCIKIHSNWKKP